MFVTRLSRLKMKPGAFCICLVNIYKTDWQFTQTRMIKQMASLKFYIIMIVTSFCSCALTILNISNPQFGRILLLLTIKMIKAKREFSTLETAPELCFCQNKNESKLNECFIILNLNEVHVFKGIV